MQRVMVKIIMFVSSYFPLYIIFLLTSIYSYWENRDFGYLKIGFLILILMLVGLSLLSIVWLRDKECGNTLKYIEINKRGELAVNYLVTYLIPIVGMKIDDMHSVIVNLSFFILIGFLYVKQELMYMNPLWASFGFQTYECNNCFIITDIPFSVLKRKKNSLVRGYFLADGIFVAHKENNLEIDE